MLFMQSVPASFSSRVEWLILAHRVAVRVSSGSLIRSSSARSCLWLRGGRPAQGACHVSRTSRPGL